jgi:hypothetical protein
MVGLRHANPTYLAGKPCHAEPLLLHLGTDPSPLAQDDTLGKA